MTMAKTFYDPFTNDGTAIDGVLTPKGGSPWDGYNYKDARGETWEIVPLIPEPDHPNQLVPTFGLLSIIKDLKGGSDIKSWRATLPANQSATPPHQSIALYSKTLVSTLEDIDNAAYELKLRTGGGGWFWLALLAVWALSSKGKR